MSIINENIYETIQEVNHRNDYQKSEQRLNECEEVSERQKVDINVLFDVEKASINGELESDVHSADQYSVDNAVNREHRHVFLRRIRITRGVSVVLALLTLMFFIGLILTVFSAFNVKEEETVFNDLEHQLNAEHLVHQKPPQDVLEANLPFDTHIDVIIKPNHEFTTELSLPSTTTTTTTTQTPITDRFNDSINEGLDDIAPDSSLQKFFDRLRNDRNEFNLQDIPPALDQVMLMVRRVLHFPTIRFDFQDK